MSCWLTFCCYVESFETNIFTGRKRSNLGDFERFNLSLIYQLTTRVGILSKVNAPIVCCFLKIQAPSGGRKQNCRFISVYTTTDPNLLFGFSTALLYNMRFKGALQTSEECLDWQLEHAQNKEHANVTIICSRSSAYAT